MDLLECLKDMKAVLDRHQIIFWLEHGTLLGFVREGKIIEYDDDIDISTFSNSLIPKIEKVSKELYDLGYDVYISNTKLTARKGKNHASLYLYNLKTYGKSKYIIRNRISKKDIIGNILQYVFLQSFKTPHIDYIHNFTLKTKALVLSKQVVMRLPAKKQLYNLLLSFGKRTNHLFPYDININSFFVSGFKSVDFHDIEVNIPIKSEEYLERIYGEDWKTPDKSWNVWNFYKLMRGQNVKLDLLTHLQLIVDVLNKNKIPFWMYGGSLLGYVRDKELIPWDRDIDLFVWKSDYHKIFKIKNELKELGFRFLVRENTVMLKWADKNITIGNYKLDGDYAIRDKLSTKNKIGNIIYFGFLIKAVKHDMQRTYLFLKWLSIKLGGCYQMRQIVPSHFYFELKEIDFFGVSLKVPANTEDYLKYTYGDDWRIPKKKFKYTSDYIQVTRGKKPIDGRVR